MISYYKTIDNFIVEIKDYVSGCWVNVISPNKDEIAFLRDNLGVETEYVLDSLDEEEASRIEFDDGNTFIIFDVPCVEKEGSNIFYDATPIGVMVTKDCVISIAHKDNPVLMDFTHGVVRGVQTEHKTRFVLMMLSRMATRFLQYLKQIDRYSSNLETKLRKSMKNKELVQLLDLQKSLVYFQTSLKSNEITVQKMLRGKFLKMYDDDSDLLDDVIIELRQAIEMSTMYSSVLANSMNAFSSVISNNLNDVMKRLTSITILMAIPTMIFSFFGMNIGGEISGKLPLASNMIFVSILTVVSTIVVGVVLFRKDMF